MECSVERTQWRLPSRLARGVLMVVVVIATLIAYAPSSSAATIARQGSVSPTGMIPLEPPQPCGGAITFISTKRSGNVLSTKMVVSGLDGILPSWSDVGIITVTWFRNGTLPGDVKPPYNVGRKSGAVIPMSYRSSAPLTVRVTVETEEHILTMCDEEDYLG